MQRFDRLARGGVSDELRQDLPTEDLLGPRVGDRKNCAAVAVFFDAQHDAKLLQIHPRPAALSASAIASSSNFLTLPDGVIGRESTKCHATGVFWRARPVACRCPANSPEEGRPTLSGTTNATGTSPNL